MTVVVLLVFFFWTGGRYFLCTVKQGFDYGSRVLLGMVRIAVEVSVCIRWLAVDVDLDLVVDPRS